MLISNNTGPFHIAAAVGTPVVDLYALTNPQHTPWMVASRVLYQDVPCKFCYKSICPEGHHHCLSLVAPETVVQAASELMGETSRFHVGEAGSMKPRVDILIPTFNRPGALAVTLTSLVGQTYREFRLVISDQTDGWDIAESGEVKAVLRVLRSHGHPVEVHKHLPRRGMAEQRQFLLDQVKADFALFLDDDLILEPFVVEQMLTAIQEERCGFVGSAVIGLSFIDDVRPQEQRIEFWEWPGAAGGNFTRFDAVAAPQAAQCRQSIPCPTAAYAVSGADT